MANRRPRLLHRWRTRTVITDGLIMVVLLILAVWTVLFS